VGREQHLLAHDGFWEFVWQLMTEDWTSRAYMQSQTQCSQMVSPKGRPRSFKAIVTVALSLFDVSKEVWLLLVPSFGRSERNECTTSMTWRSHRLLVDYGPVSGGEATGSCIIWSFEGIRKGPLIASAHPRTVWPIHFQLETVVWCRRVLRPPACSTAKGDEEAPERAN